MQNIIRTKLSYLFIGLVLGLALGIAITSLLDEESSTEGKQKKAPVLNTASTEEVSKKEKKIAFEEPKKRQSKPEEESDKMEVVEKDTAMLATEDSLQIDTTSEALADSSSVIKDIGNSDSTERVLADDEEIIVKKDRLIESRTVQVIMLDSVKQPSRKDSLLGELAGMKPQKMKDQFVLEFWQSPINYSGYKMGNNKVVLFGLDADIEPVILFQLDEVVYLRHNAIYLRIDHTFAFKPFREVKDEAVIQELENAFKLLQVSGNRE